MNDVNQSQPVNQTQPKAIQLGQMLQSRLQGTAQSTSSTQMAPSSNASQAQPQDTIQQNLGTFEEVLDEIQNSVPHGVVQAVDQATDTLNPQQQSIRTAKEHVGLASSPDASVVDMGGGVQTVEHEKNPEIPVEVESFLQRVEDHHETAPTEVVIADGTSEVPSNSYPSMPVIVLPITQDEDAQGAKKSTKFSFRWLVEFSHKIIKMFTGKVIYRQEE